MANFAQSDERFVEVPEIIEITWRSDDPDFYQKPTDLFDEQAKGKSLSHFDGKKNKVTLEQAFFTCKLCECECKSVVTLRAHCRGTQHTRKALTKKKEYFDALKVNSSKSKGNNAGEYSSRGNYKKEESGEYSSRGNCKKEESGDSRTYKEDGKENKNWLKKESNVFKNNNENGNCKKEESDDSGTYKKDGNENKNWVKRESFVLKNNNDNVKEGKRDWVEAKMNVRGGKYRKKNEGGSEEMDGNVKMHDEKGLSFKHKDIQSSQDYVAKSSPTKMREVEKLHQKVAECVKRRLNKYLDDMDKTEPRNRKLPRSEYAELAKKFTHNMRSMIKDSYQTIHGSLDGIEFTLDQQEQINAEIDMYFDPLPVNPTYEL